MAVTDLTGYTWVGKPNGEAFIDQPVFVYHINFDTNNQSYTSFIADWDTAMGSGRGLHYGGWGSDGVHAYGGKSTFTWKNEAYRTIVITGGADVSDANLISLLQANGTLTASTPKISIDLTTLSGWSSLSDGQHTITVKAKATGYRDSIPSSAVSVTKQAPMPVM